MGRLVFLLLLSPLAFADEQSGYCEIRYEYRDGDSMTCKAENILYLRFDTLDLKNSLPPETSRNVLQIALEIRAEEYQNKWCDFSKTILSKTLGNVHTTQCIRVDNKRVKQNVAIDFNEMWEAATKD